MQHNVIHIVDSFHFRGHLCIGFELLGQNLYDLMRERKFQGLDVALVQKFTGQLLTTLCFLRGEGIIHCDLKPENVLLRINGGDSLRVRAVRAPQPAVCQGAPPTASHGALVVRRCRTSRVCCTGD